MGGGDLDMTAELAQARQATRWAALTPAQQKEVIRQRTYHYLTYAEAKRWLRHNPRRQIVFKARFGSLNVIPAPVLAGPLE